MTKPKSKTNEKSLSKHEQAKPEPLITRLTSIQEQVGQHVIMALQRENTVAVLSTVMAGQDGNQHIVSVSLNQELLENVEELLAKSQADELPRVPCVGFHCYLPKKTNG